MTAIGNAKNNGTTSRTTSVWDNYNNVQSGSKSRFVFGIENLELLISLLTCVIITCLLILTIWYLRKKMARQVGSASYTSDDVFH